MSRLPRHHPWAAFLARVQKPSRYTGGEYGERPIDLATARARVCLAFPDAYEIGMSHLGTKILYGLLNKADGIVVERVFAPWLDMEQELRRRSLPLSTLETGSRLGDFDIIGFSLQYELNYTGVLSILDLGGIPLRSAGRLDTDPLVLAGGPVATHPEPLAPFIDAFFIGEAEELLPALCLEAGELRRARLPRLEVLARLAERYPLYVPALHATHRDPATGFTVVGEPVDTRAPRQVRRVWVKDINRFPFPDDSPLPHGEAVFDRMAVEIARGCTEGCRFCQAGIIYRPLRERDPVAVIDALVGGIRRGGYDATSLASLSPADYSCVTPLVRRAMAKLRDEKVSLSVSSLRAYGLDEELLGDLAAGGITGLTFSPEAGTQRMRDLVNKNVTEADILESAHRVFSRGHQRMKLYFMIGLPTETDEDAIGIVQTAARVQEIGRRYLRSARVAVAVSTFVPKPHTPFQWAGMDSRAETARKHALLAEHARRLRVDLRMHENVQSHLEAIFARGDRACADVLERAFRLGCRFDGWNEVLRPDLWEQAIAEEKAAHGFDPERYLSAIAEDARLPWDHIDVGVEQSFLRKELRLAMQHRASPPCGKPAGQLLHPASVAEAEAIGDRKLVCYDCGVACDLDGMKAERLFFLRRMNAWAPRPPMPSRRRDNSAGGLPRSSPRPTTESLQGEPARLRLRYSKLGPAAFLAHLDLVRHLPRAFRRAGLEIYYSKGFHPKPCLSFGPALGLGIRSLGEYLDVKLVENLTAEEILRRLQEVSPAGIEFLAAATLGDGDPPLGRVVTEAHYAVRLPEGFSARTAESLWNAGAPLMATRRERSDSRRSDHGNTMDVRKSIVFARAVGAEEGCVLAAKLGWPAREEPGLAFGLVVSALGSARPVEVIEAFFGEGAAEGCEIVRTRLYATAGGGKVDPLEVAAFREEDQPQR